MIYKFSLDEKYNFHFFFLLASPLYANGEKLYRADSRPPDEIKRSGGLMPRGHNEYFDRGTQMNLIFMITREEHKPALSDMMTDMFPLLLV